MRVSGGFWDQPEPPQIASSSNGIRFVSEPHPLVLIRCAPHLQLNMRSEGTCILHILILWALAPHLTLEFFSSFIDRAIIYLCHTMSEESIPSALRVVTRESNIFSQRGRDPPSRSPVVTVL